MIFIMKRDLNNFGLFECLKDEEGRKLLTEMYESYIKVGETHENKMLLLTPTWRCSLNHMTSMGYEEADVEKYNQLAAEFMKNFRDTHKGVAMTIGGQVGPAGDGYVVEKMMTCEEAHKFHTPDVSGLAKGGVEWI